MATTKLKTRNDLVRKSDGSPRSSTFYTSTRIESKAPKYEMVSTHTARRTFITLTLERGTRSEIGMHITGHKDIKMMMKYVRLTDKAAHQEFLRSYGKNTMKILGKTPTYIDSLRILNDK